MTDQDYAQAGFNKFMSRSVDQTPEVNLDSPVPAGNSTAFDRTQITGPVGDTFRIGNILFDGSAGRITMQDENGNDTLLIGTDV